MKLNNVSHIFVISLLSIIASSVSADTIETIKINDIERYANSHSNDKPLIIHLSSNDRGCGPCLINNGGISEAADDLSKQYNIAAVYFQPWGSISKHKELVKNLK